MSQPGMPVLYVVACGGRPAADLPAFVRRAQTAGWDVCVIATPSGTKFLDAEDLAALTGHPVRSEYKKPHEPDVLPPPDAFVVAPATFNTVNKFAAGISDTLALGLLNEALGAGLPIVMAPFPNRMLARHPAFTASVSALRSWGVRLVFDPAADWLPGPDRTESGNAPFPWRQLADALNTTISSSDLAGRVSPLIDSGDGRTQDGTPR
jgi:phosphopantothenoylcysteine synthetase/decarboxylase